MSKTKKVGSAGRFGPRYGVKIRKAVAAIEKRQRSRFICPACGSRSVKRVGTGIFQCRKCGKIFAGGAYVFETITGEEVRKVVG